MKNAEIKIEGSDYIITVHDPDTDRERMTMYDDQSEEHVLYPQMMNRSDLTAVVKLVEKAYLKGRADGKTDGVYAARAEIRNALGIS